MTYRYRWALVVALGAAINAPILALPSRALAADETAKARTLFQNGVQLEAGGNYSAALSKFQEVAQVKRTPSVIFHVAFCQEKLGQLVEALGGYRIAAHDAADDPKLAKVASTAQDAVTALEKRIPTLVVKRAKGAELAKVSLDGIEISGMIGKPNQVDPGAHVVEATASGKEPFKEVVQIAESEAKSLDIVMKDKPGAVTAPHPSGSSSSEAPPPPTSSATPDAPPGRSAVPYVVGGVGLASLVVSGVFFLMRNGAKSDLDAMCAGPNKSICPASAKSTQDKGNSDATLSTVFLAVGLAGVGVGVTLFALNKPSPSGGSSSGSSESASAGPRVDLRLNPLAGGMGANVVGSF